MQTIALLLAGSLLTAPEDKPNIPDYFDGNGKSHRPKITMAAPTLDIGLDVVIG